MTASAATDGVRDEQRRVLRQYGCPPVLLSLLSDDEVARCWFCRYTTGSGDYYVVSADADSSLALYVDRDRILVVLEPEDARALVATTGAKLRERDATWLVEIVPALAADSEIRETIVAAINRALARSAITPASTPGQRVRQETAPPQVCPDCHHVLPATGVCDDHGRTAAGPHS
jgi:hypothetical protein